MINTHALMDGIRKVVMSGAVPSLRNVVFSVGASPHTTGDTIHLPTLDVYASPEDALLWRYYAEHELGHEDPINCVPHWRDVMSKEANLDPLTKTIWNLFSDHYQEYRRIGQYVGRDEVLLKGREIFFQRQLLKVGKALGTTPLHVCFQWDMLARSKWNPHLTVSHTNPENDPLVSAIMALTADVPKNEAEVLALAKEVRKLWPDVPQEKPDPSKGGGMSAAEWDKLMKEAVKQYESMAASVHSDDEDEEAGGGMGKGGGELEFATRVPQYFKLPPTTVGAFHSKISEDSAKSNLPAKLRAFLVGQRACRSTTGYRSGRLDTNRLADVMRGRDDVFRRNETGSMVDASVLLLIDASASMSISPNGRFAKAATAAVMMGDALSAAKASVRIEAFTEDYGGHESMGVQSFNLAHMLIKDWNDRFNRTTVLSRLAACAPLLQDNSDGESILWAYHQLKKQPTSKKLLVVLSDGAPSATGPVFGADIVNMTVNTIKMIEADKSVKLVGVGMGGHHVPLYSNRIVLADDGDVAGVLLDLAKSVYL